MTEETGLHTSDREDLDHVLPNTDTAMSSGDDDHGAGTPSHEHTDTASTAAAEALIRAGEYAQAVDMYRQMLAESPADTDLAERLKDAEILAELLTIRGDDAVYAQGYEDGKSAADAPAADGPVAHAADPMATPTGISREERITRLSAWLQRIRQAPS